MTEDRARSLLELLIHVSREVATALDLRTVLQRLLFSSLQYVGGERGSIVVLDDHGKPVDATIVYGKQLHEHTTQQLRDTVERGLAGWVVQRRKPALVMDTTKDERWLRRADDADEKSGAKSAICVPLLARERLVGVLTLVHPAPGGFTQEHLDLMQAIADQASIAVLNARLYTESQRTARVMTALAEGSAAINASLELSDVWRRILNYTMQALQVETVALGLAEPASGDLIFEAATGHHSGNIPGRRIAAGQGFAGRVIQSGQGIVAPNLSGSKTGQVDQFAGIEMRAIAIAPIRSQGKVIGVLEAINPIAQKFDPDALLVMSGLGSLAGGAIQNAQFLDKLQKAHERYRELFEDSIDPILITDWDGKVLEANRHAIALSGYDEETLRSMSIDQLHEVKWNNVGLNFETLKEQEECRYESYFHLQNGKTLPVDVYARRIEFEETDSAQWILRDVTERKDLDALRNDLAAMIYHDLRSPLGNIVSSLEMLKSALSDNDSAQEMLAIAEHSSARMKRLINSLLDINRLEVGKPIANHSAVDAWTLITDALQGVAPLAEGKQQTVKNIARPPLSKIWVDADMASRVLINLIENACKFTPAGGVIQVDAQPMPDGFVQFSVRDSGPGISQADAERIFEKFTRLRSAEKTTGLGIGLAFCRLAVRAHGGNIWVESAEAQGSVFHFTLPVAP
ncbi:MAG: GAF domain-containing protein [Anaerolineales bacterium]